MRRNGIGSYEFVMRCGWLRCHVVWFEVVVWCGESDDDLVIRTTEYYKYYTVLQGNTEYYSMLQDTTKFYSVLHSSTKYYSARQNTTKCYTVLQVLHSTRNYQDKVLLGTTQYYKVLHSTTKYYKVVLHTKKYYLLRTTKYYSLLQSTTTPYYKVIQRLPRKMTSQHMKKICWKQMKRHLQWRTIRAWSGHELVISHPPVRRGCFARFGDAFYMEKYSISRASYLPKFH